METIGPDGAEAAAADHGGSAVVRSTATSSTATSAATGAQRSLKRPLPAGNANEEDADTSQVPPRARTDGGGASVHDMPTMKRE